MYLKNLNIIGFKSFGAKNILEFPPLNNKKKGLAAVIGPNGSGKSNIADAIRWVLGEQSPKILRIKKNEDLIFFGSKKKGKGSFSEVALVLDNSDKRMDIDYSEVEISRRLYRSGENEYLLNNKKVRLADIQELLAKCGFGRASYTVIGQGMIDSLLFYGPQERKELFEEASGVKHYEMKRDQSIKKLEATERNIVRIRDLLYELEPRLKVTERQYKKYVNKKVIEERLRTSSELYYSSKYFFIFEESGKTETELSKFDKKLDELEKEIIKISGKIQTGFLVNSREKKDRENLKNQINILNTKKNEVIGQIFQLQAEVKSKKAIYEEGDKVRGEELERNEGEIINLEARIKNLEGDFSLSQENIKELKRALESTDREIILANEKLEKFRSESIDLGRREIAIELEDILSEYQEFLKNISSASSLKDMIVFKDKGGQILVKLNSLTGRLKEDRTKELSHKINVLQDKVKKMSQEKEKALTILHNERVKKSSSEELIKNLSDRVQSLKKTNRSIAEKLERSNTRGLTQNIKEIEGKIAELELEKESIQSEGTALEAELTNIEDKDRGIEKRYNDLYLQQRQKEIEKSSLESQINLLNLDLARFQEKQENLRSEIVEHLGNDFFDSIKKSKRRVDDAVDLEALYKKIHSLRRESYTLGDIDPFINEEFEDLSKRVTELRNQFEDMEKANLDLHDIISELDSRIKTQFKATFSKIADQFTNYFKILFDGGEANLELQVADDNKFSVEINATPPGKKNQALASLSGGERTMTAIALLFAIISVNPSPFVVLDEVDAALDETNTEKFLTILKTLSEKSQFIMITHNQESMKKADYLYGVSMDGSHLSRTYSLKLTQ